MPGESAVKITAAVSRGIFRGRRLAAFAVLFSAWMALAPDSATSGAAGPPSRTKAVPLSVLIGRIPAVARDDAGIGPEEDELAHAIQSHGAAAIPLLLPLLESGNPAERRLAGYILCDIDGLTEKELDALIAARLRGDGWIPAAIGRIGTPRAIRFLIEDMKKDPDYGSNSQVFMALSAAGKTAAVLMAERFSTPARIERPFSLGICQVYREMGDKAEPAVGPLSNVAFGDNNLLDNRKEAALALGCIGPAARAAVPRLKRLAASDPGRFSEVVETAIVTMGVPESASLFAARLRAKPDIRDLRDLAAIRENGRRAGPVLVELLSSPDPYIRWGAARTIGFVGYAEGAAALVEVLGDRDDWRLPHAAAESLGRLKAKKAVPALQKLAGEHWYPPVREAAKKAIRAIRGKVRYVSRYPKENFAFEFFDYERIGLGETRPGKREDRRGAGPGFVAQEGQLTREELETLSYEVEIAGYGETGRHVDRQMAHPGVGLKVPGGFVVGSDRGEWGGELVFLDGKGGSRRLADKNIHGIFRMPFGIIAVSGLAHMTLNDGALFLVEFSPAGDPKSALWKVLPGAPEKCGMLSNGSLFIGCLGGNVVVTPDGRMTMAGKKS